MKKYKDALKEALERALGVEITPFATITRSDFRYPATFFYLSGFDRREGLFELVFTLEHVVRGHFLDGEQIEEALLEFLAKVREKPLILFEVDGRAHTVYLDTERSNVWRVVDDAGYFVAGVVFNIRLVLEEG